MDNQTRNVQATADTAEAERKGAAAELGKFKDVEALKQAYEALEAEFTRRSQRLKELEAANKERSALPANAVNEADPSPEAINLPQADKGAAPLSEEVKNAVIEEYLSGVRAGRGVPIITGGSVVPAKRRVPQNFKEAGMLAKNFFDNKEDKN